MSNKEILFSEYSQQFADRVTGEYFARNSRVTSKTIMEVQSIKQVNLFVIKNLYDQWQSETAKNRSPFFDYENPDVQTALQSYMNTLSHHISLDQPSYKELLQKSVVESLNLVFYPFDFYHGLLSEHSKEGITQSYLKNISKYIKTNNHILQHMLEVMQGNNIDELSKDKIMWLLDEALGRTNEDPADVEPFLKDFSEIIPLKMEDVYDDSPSYSPLDTMDSEDDELIDDAEDEEDESDLRFDYEKAEDRREQNQNEKEKENENEDEDEDEVRADDEPEIEFPDAHKKFSDDSKKGRNLAEALANRVDYSFDTPEKSMLNDILSHDQRETLADHHQNARIKNIRKHLSINQRFMFINALFQGDEQAFDRTLEHLETVSSSDEAISFLTHKYTSWDESSEEVQEFLQIVQRRFSP